MALILIIVLWYVIGFIAPLYFLKKIKGPIGLGEFCAVVFVGLMGPLAWVVGWYIHHHVLYPRRW